MKPPLFADESVYGPIVARLLNDGWDVVRTVDLCPGADDDIVLDQAVASGRVLLTEDFDFGDLVVRRGLPAAGVVVLDLDRLSARRRVGA